MPDRTYGGVRRYDGRGGKVPVRRRWPEAVVATVSKERVSDPDERVGEVPLPDTHAGLMQGFLAESKAAPWPHPDCNVDVKRLPAVTSTSGVTGPEPAPRHVCRVSHSVPDAETVVSEISTK